MAANFVEVFLAREGHVHPVGINFLEKIQMPHLPSLYGAMLAGVRIQEGEQQALDAAMGALGHGLLYHNAVPPLQVRLLLRQRLELGQRHPPAVVRRTRRFRVRGRSGPRHHQSKYSC